MAMTTGLTTRWRQRLEPAVALFRQGLTPEKVALCLVAGAVISIFPILGTTTLICFLVAFYLKLNLAAIQAVNWLFAGVQLVLMVPFLRIGERLLGVRPFPLSPARVAELARAGPLAFLSELGAGLLHAVLGWAVVALPAAVLVYLAMVWWLRQRRPDR